nr:aldo/keto reductase family oxidoreductase [Micromonospora sp. RL09-050-HVF-A]
MVGYHSVDHEGRGNHMLTRSLPGGTWTLGDLTVTRSGYGAMQLAGPG